MQTQHDLVMQAYEQLIVPAATTALEMRPPVPRGYEASLRQKQAEVATALSTLSVDLVVASMTGGVDQVLSGARRKVDSLIGVLDQANRQTGSIGRLNESIAAYRNLQGQLTI